MDFFTFEGGNTASVNNVNVANILNGDREIIYGTYQMIKVFLWRVDRHLQFPPYIPGPWQISAGESFSVLFHHVDKYQIKIFHIMIVEYIEDLIEQELLVGITAINFLPSALSYMMRYLFFSLYRESMFVMHL